MNLISYPILKQYMWYHKKLNTEYFTRILPILCIKCNYHMYYTDSDLKSFKKINLHFSSGESCEFEKKIYYVGTFTNHDHDNVVSKLSTIYKIVYIDVDDKFIWKERINIKNEVNNNFLNNLLNFNVNIAHTYNQPSEDFVIGIVIPTFVTNNITTHTTDPLIISPDTDTKDFYNNTDNKVSEINIISTEIFSGTGIKKHQEVFEGDDFIIIESNDADI